MENLRRRVAGGVIVATAVERLSCGRVIMRLRWCRTREVDVMRARSLARFSSDE